MEKKRNNYIYYLINCKCSNIELTPTKDHGLVISEFSEGYLLLS